MKEVEVEGDSQLVIRQMNGVYKARSPNLQDLYKRAMELKEAFEFCKFVHVQRKENQKVDELATKALAFLKEATLALIDTCWPELQDVQYYLKEKHFPHGLSPQQKKRLTRKAYPYTILGDVLYKQGKDKVLRRVVSLEESKRILELCHECSGHFASASTTRKILNTGYCWPRLNKDVHEWCRSCE